MNFIDITAPSTDKIPRKFVQWELRCSTHTAATKLTLSATLRTQLQ